MACTGIEFCKLAIVDTKNRADLLIEEMQRRIPELDEPITINVNGCPNSCARIQTADIGLKGQLVMENGTQVEGFQVHLGGALGLTPGFGRKLRAHKVTAAGLPDYVEHLVRAYLDQRTTGESFAEWVARAEEDVLR
jgi:sulfite reductase (ferredoxin)